MANGSLADCLALKVSLSFCLTADPHSDGPVLILQGRQAALNCVKRVRVAHDVAKALLYLHAFPGCPMLHLNVKRFVIDFVLSYCEILSCGVWVQLKHPSW